jgi:hypothetical protein
LKTSRSLAGNGSQLNEVAFSTTKFNLKHKIMNTEKILLEAQSQPSCLGAVMRSIFPKKSNWIDIYMFENSGKYKLIQMRYRLDNNKKEFRTASIGFVNDYTVKLKIYENVLLERS